MPHRDDTEVRTFALKLLARREHSTFELRNKLATRFPKAPESTLEDTMEFCRARRFLDDERFASHVVGTSLHRGRPWLEAKLKSVGVDDRILARVLDAIEWPTLEEAIEQNVARMKLKRPLETKDAVRLSRVLARLGYDIDEIQLELERLT